VSQLWWLLVLPIGWIAAVALREMERRKHRLAVAPARVRPVENTELTTTHDRIAKVAAGRDVSELAEAREVGSLGLLTKEMAEEIAEESDWDEPWSDEYAAERTHDGVVLAVRDRCTNMLALFEDEPVTPLVVPRRVDHATDPDVIEAHVVGVESWSEMAGWSVKRSWPLILAAANGNADEELILRRAVDDTPLPLFEETTGRHAMPVEPDDLGSVTTWWTRGGTKTIEAGS
jgi:hypothetical protein